MELRKKVGTLSIEVVNKCSDRGIRRKGITCFLLSFPTTNFSTWLSVGILSHFSFGYILFYCRNDTPMSTKGNAFLCACTESQSIIRKICEDTTTVSYIRCLLGIFLLPQMLLGFNATTTYMYSSIFGRTSAVKVCRKNVYANM